MKFRIETHGCKLNTADSQQLAREFVASGFDMAGPAETPDVFVLNSCTVTNTADRKARQAISSARRKYPAALVVATGCYAERDLASVGALESVDLALNNRQKPAIVQSVAERLGVAFTPCADGDTAPLETALLGRTRASVKIQEGCDQVCAYCIVPKVRGRERSIPVSEIVGKVNRLVSEGCSEVVLTGTQLGTYGFDLDRTDGAVDLPGLLNAIIAETDLPRLRVSSLQPLEITNELMAAWTESDGRICPHFHIPLQSGSDSVLEQMRRRYTGRQFLDAVERVRASVPGCSITTDVISGFPGETDDDHSETLRVVEQARFADAHVFPYSERPGTSAAHFTDQVDPRIRSERAAEIREITSKQARDFREASIGQVRPVLWEGARGRSGLTDNYLRVRGLLANDESTGRMGTRQGAKNLHPVEWPSSPSRTGRESEGGPAVTAHGDGLIEDVKITGIDVDGVLTTE